MGTHNNRLLFRFLFNTCDSLARSGNLAKSNDNFTRSGICLDQMRIIIWPTRSRICLSTYLDYDICYQGSRELNLSGRYEEAGVREGEVVVLKYSWGQLSKKNQRKIGIFLSFSLKMCFGCSKNISLRYNLESSNLEPSSSQVGFEA